MQARGVARTVEDQADDEGRPLISMVTPFQDQPPILRSPPLLEMLLQLGNHRQAVGFRRAGRC
jgi:hypothetical protein